ncbi:hypothetical protein KPH14_008973 [Odynerus spinipes]|uniref:C2H2-type domain-containing protein n=1 Tax=Odynerus spinipes TaxID=1348599 RepID=A0AAD9VR23_9HYME|nr:hypothetical protein KPH14_008973 [Odynerus spinipes]
MRHATYSTSLGGPRNPLMDYLVAQTAGEKSGDGGSRLRRRCRTTPRPPNLRRSLFLTAVARVKSPTSDSVLVDTDPTRVSSMTAINSGPVGEVGGVRLPLQSLHGYGSVFMYSALTSPGGGGGQAGGGGGEVTLRLREPEDIPEEVLARLEDTATLSISLQGDAVLRLGAAAAGNGSLELFDSESGPDLTLSPQTFTSTAEAFINDNSDSLGVPGDNDTGSSEESKTGAGDPGKRGVKRPRSKASSPVRQGPQQCQVCGKVFSNASALTKHKLTHSNERKYVCLMCGKAFKRQDHFTETFRASRVSKSEKSKTRFARKGTRERLRIVC